MDKPLVHNHDTETGKGIGCQERVVDGFLRGECFDTVYGMPEDEWNKYGCGCTGYDCDCHAPA